MTAVFNFDDLIEPVTPAEVESAAYQALAILGSDTTSWIEGSIPRSEISACALVIASLSNLQASIARSGFLNLSQKAWLTAVALYVYRCERQEGTFASGTIDLTNPSGGSYPVASGEWLFENPATGAQYRNDVDFVIAPHGQAFGVQISAVEMGSGSSCGAGTITRISTGSSSVNCSNASELVGLDEESDANLIIRCSEKLGSLSPNGPWDGYSYVARQAKNSAGRPLGVSRVQISKDGFGNVFVYLATAGGGLPGSLDDPNSDLWAADNAMQRFSTPIGVRLNTLPANNQPISISAVVYCYDTTGKTAQQIMDIVTANLAVYFAQLPIGGAVVPPATTGKVYRDHIIAVISSSVPEIFHVELALPTDDFVLAVGDVPVLPTINPVSDVVFVPPTEGWQQSL